MIENSFAECPGCGRGIYLYSCHVDGDNTDKDKITIGFGEICGGCARSIKIVATNYKIIAEYEEE